MLARNVSAGLASCRLTNPLQFLTIRYFHAGSPTFAKPLPPRLKIDEADLEENFLKGSGPGGQKINKTSSAVQLRHIPTGTIVKSQATRSRSQNRKIARQILAEKLEVAEKGEKSRVAIKTELKRKKKASGAKKRRRKYKLLEDEKTKGQEASEHEGDEDEDEDEIEEDLDDREHEGKEENIGKK